MPLRRLRDDLHGDKRLGLAATGTAATPGSGGGAKGVHGHRRRGRGRKERGGRRRAAGADGEELDGALRQLRRAIQHGLAHHLPAACEAEVDLRRERECGVCVCCGVG